MIVLKTEAYGDIEYEREDCIHFPDGIYGFQNLHDFLPLCLNEEDDNTLLVLQSVEDSHVGFVVINPFTLDPDYHPALSSEELSYLGAKTESDLTFYVICVLKNNYPDDTVNMKCPLVINPETRNGMQVILDDPDYQFRHKLSSFSILS